MRILSAILVCLLLTSAAPYHRLYRPGQEEMVAGEVTSVGKFTSQDGRWTGVHITLEDESGELAIHLGPSWYLKEQGITVVAGDEVTVTGCRMQFNGEPAFIAGRITKEGTTVSLRKSDGTPAWRGRGWRRGD